MLEVKNISKQFNSKEVLKNVSFNVNKGKIFGVIGPNGAGKTTTLRIILGILNASSGQIIFENNQLDQRFLNITGYLPEERGLYPKSNVLNTLIYLAQLKGLNHSTAIKNTDYWLNYLEMDEFRKYKIEELSKGNQQKIQFISSIIHDPEILILDEPFSGFDPVNQTIFREIIENFKNDKYIILSTHLMDLAENLCDEIILIDNGKSIISGNLTEILNSKENNEYKIVARNNISADIIAKYNIKKVADNIFVLNSYGKDPAEIIKEISAIIEIEEFVHNRKSLHQLFISLVNKE